MDWRLVDTNIVSYLMKRNAFGRKYRPLLLGYKLVVSFQTVAELEEGMLRANWGTEKRSQFDRTLSTMKVIHSDDVIGSWWSQIRYSRKSGIHVELSQLALPMHGSLRRLRRSISIWSHIIPRTSRISLNCVLSL